MSLVTLTDVKAFLQITTTTSDAILTIYNEYISSEIEAYVDRNLEEATYTDEVLQYQRSNNTLYQDVALNESFDNPRLFVENYPVSTLVLEVSDETITASDYRLDTTNGTIEMYRGVSDAKGKLTATYTAGYEVTATSSDVPSNLQFVAMEGIKRMFVNGGTAAEGSGDVKSKKVKDFSVSYGNSSTSEVTMSLTGLVKTYLESNSVILNRYKKVVI